MRKVILLGMLALFALPAYATNNGGNMPPGVNTTVDTNANSNSDSRASSVSGTNNAVTVAISSHTPDRQQIDYSGSYNVKSNTMVALAAGVSMSSDYCGGTASGGASAAGISVGASKPLMDRNCQALRRVEKMGVAAVTAFNLGDKVTASKLKNLMVWQLCVSDTAEDASRANQVPSVQQACLDLGLITERGMDRTTDPRPVK